MSFTHNLPIGWNNGGANSLSKVVSQSAGQELNISDSIADGLTNKAVACAIDISQMKSIYITCDKAVTIKTNSTSAPDDTFVLTADTPIVWYTGCGYTLAEIFAADVTVLYVTNASGAAAQLEIRGLIDPTI